MYSKKLVVRKYHDGKFIDGDSVVNMEDIVPEYTLFRNCSDCFDSVNCTTYSLVARYSDGSVNQWLFDDIATAFRVFRRLSIGWVSVV